MDDISNSQYVKLDYERYMNTYRYTSNFILSFIIVFSLQYLYTNKFEK